MSPQSESREVVVIGGGIAGLAAAYSLRDRDVILYEADDRIGGRIMSQARGDYWLNLGAHLMPGPDSRTGAMISALGLETAVLPGTVTGISLNGRVISTGPVETYPFRLRIPLGARVSLVRSGVKMRRAVAEYTRCARQLPGEAIEEARRRRLAFMGDTSFAEFIGKLHPDIESIFRATTARVTASMDEVSAGSGVAHFAAAMSGTKVRKLRNMLGGPSRLPEAIGSVLQERIVTGAHVERVEREGDHLVVRVTRNGCEESVRAHCAIVATPAYVTNRIVEGLPEDTAEALESIPYGPFVVVALLTGERGLAPWDHIYSLTAARASFNMFFNQANVLRTREDERRPGGSLMLYAGGELGRRLLNCSDDEILHRFTTDLGEIFGVEQGIVREGVVRRWPQGVPYVGPGRHRLQPSLERDLENIFLAGDYFDFPGIEGAVDSALHAAEGARRRLPGAGP